MYGCCTHAGKTRIDVIPHKEYESQECYVHPWSSSRDIITNKSGLYIRNQQR
jgi:hypothetical protein